MDAMLLGLHGCSALQLLLPISNLKSPERERILGLWSVRPLSMRTRVLLLITNHLQEHTAS